MEIMEPVKAAMIITPEVATIDFPRRKIIVSATISLAPEEIPRTKGPAIGFPKKSEAKILIRTKRLQGSRLPEFSEAESPI